MNNTICIYENKMKMYFSGIAVFWVIVILFLSVSNILIQDYGLLFKWSVYIFLFFLSMSFQFLFRPKHSICINKGSIVLYYGVNMKHIKHNFCIADIVEVEVIDRFFYEKIKICTIENCINIRSSEYSKTDYDRFKNKVVAII